MSYVRSVVVPTSRFRNGTLSLLQGMDLRLEGLASPGSGASTVQPENESNDFNHHGVIDSDAHVCDFVLGSACRAFSCI